MRKRRNPTTEIGLHMSVAAFIRVAWPEQLPWTHFPAGEKRDARTGAKLKAMGLAAGWPDFLFVLPNGLLATIELKKPGGRTSEAQDDFAEKAQACGCGVAVCYSVEDVQAVLTRWLELFGLKLRAKTGPLL